MKDPESRKRNLHIRTYTVIPLNETNGIIEWVNNLQPFRIILTKLYKARPGFKMIKAEEQKNFVTIANDFEGKIFTNLLLNMQYISLINETMVWILMNDTKFHLRPSLGHFKLTIWFLQDFAPSLQIQ